MHPFFVRLDVFSPFLRKKVENAPKFGTFGCFFKNIIKKNIFLTDRPKYSEIPLEGNNNLFFWP